MKRGLIGHDMLSCVVHLVNRKSNIVFSWRNIMLGQRNLHKLSFYFVYSKYTSYSFEPYNHPSLVAQNAIAVDCKSGFRSRRACALSHLGEEPYFQ